MAQDQGVFQQVMKDGSALAVILDDDEEPVALPGGGWTEGVVEGVAADLNGAMSGVKVEALPR